MSEDRYAKTAAVVLEAFLDEFDRPEMIAAKEVMSINDRDRALLGTAIAFTVGWIEGDAERVRKDMSDIRSLLDQKLGPESAGLFPPRTAADETKDGDA